MVRRSFWMLHIIKPHVIIVVVVASVRWMGNAANAYARRNKFAVPSMRTRSSLDLELALTREKGFEGFRASNFYRAHYTRPRKKPPAVSSTLSTAAREGAFPRPSARIKKRTRSLIISVEAQESAKRRSSAWRAARKSARVTDWILRGSSTALSIRLSAPFLLARILSPLTRAPPRQFAVF